MKYRLGTPRATGCCKTQGHPCACSHPSGHQIPSPERVTLRRGAGLSPVPARASQAPVTPCAGEPLDTEGHQPGLAQSHTHHNKNTATAKRSHGATCCPAGTFTLPSPSWISARAQLEVYGSGGAINLRDFPGAEKQRIRRKRGMRRRKKGCITGGCCPGSSSPSRAMLGVWPLSPAQSPAFQVCRWCCL